MFGKTRLRLENLSTPADLGIGWKIYACTIGTMLVVGVAVTIAILEGRLPKPTIAEGLTFIIGTATFGAATGALLAIKDSVTSRIAKGMEVSLPLRVAFGMGVYSMVLVWVPIAFVMTGITIYVIME